jgi:hypothetical protein
VLFGLIGVEHPSLCDPELAAASVDILKERKKEGIEN